MRDANIFDKANSSMHYAVSNTFAAVAFLQFTVVYIFVVTFAASAKLSSAFLVMIKTAKYSKCKYDVYFLKFAGDQ